MPSGRAAVLIGAPTDIGASDRGASMGPEALRVAGLAEALRARGLDIVDRGNLTGPANPWQPATEGYRHLAYAQVMSGFTVKDGLPGSYGAALERLYAEGRAWLAGASSPWLNP